MPTQIEKHIDDGGEIVFTARGFIKLMAFIAYREFEKTPRAKARKTLNLIMSLARQNGMNGEKNFSDFIGNDFVKSEELDAFTEEILEHVTETQAFGLMQYI